MTSETLSLHLALHPPCVWILLNSSQGESISERKGKPREDTETEERPLWGEEAIGRNAQVGEQLQTEHSLNKQEIKS